jgi:hypothetical protein
MDTLISTSQTQSAADIYDPSSNGSPVAETVDGQLIALYREDTGEKLLIPGELAIELRRESERRQAAEQRAEQAKTQVEVLKARLREMGVDPES